MNIVRKIHDLFRVKTVAGAQLETPEAVSSLGAGGSTFITIAGGGASLSGSGLSELDRVKLDSIELGALVNLDAFSKILFDATSIDENNLSSSSNGSIIANVPTDTANIKIVGNYPITVNLESVSLFNSNTSTTTGTAITTYNISFNDDNNIVIEYVDGTLLNVADIELIQIKHKEDILATYQLSDITYTTSDGTITSFTIPYSNTDFSEIEFCKYETITTETETGSTTVRELRVLSTLPASPTKQSIITLNSLTDSFWNYEEDENGNKFVWTDYNVYSTKDVSAYGRSTDLGDTYASNLYELKDVVLTNLSNNDLLIYNSSTSKWVNINKDLLGISAGLLHTLTISVNGVTQAVYNPASANASVNISTITLDEVTEYIDLKIDTKLDASEFFKWFTINYDSNNNVVSIQANFDFYSIEGVSAYGLGEGEEEPSYVSELGLLSDVILTNVALNNILLYDGNKWVNKPMSSIVVDAYTKSEIDTKLSSISSEISTLKSNVTSILSNITTILNSISGITSDVSTINATISDILTTLTSKLDKDDFFTWFTIIKNTSGEVVSIQANFDFYSIGEVSAYGLGDIGGSGRTTLATLDDVSLSNLITNDMLAYNGSKWVNIPMSQVRGATSWADLENKPTTISGFGITDAYTKTEVNTKISEVSSKVTELSSTKADATIQVIAGDGLTGGGNLQQDVTISLLNLNSTGTYYKVNVDAYGRVTSGISLLTIADILNLQTQLDSKLNIADFNTWFTIIYNTDGTIKNIRANYDFYSVGEVSAYGIGDEEKKTYTTLAELNDVQLTNVKETDVLVYNGTKWINVDQSTIKGALSWVDIQNKPTTIAGFGIVDAYTKTEIDNKLSPINSSITTINSSINTINTNISDLSSSLSGVSTKLNNFLEGSDTDTIINKWKELEAFLAGYTQTQTLADLLSVKANSSILIIAGTGLVGGGDLTANRTISLGTSGVSAGTYTKVTVDTYGRVTSGSTLSATDIPDLDWSKITSGKPTTLEEYGITDGVNSITITGSGNAITAVTISNHLLTFTKGETFLPKSTFDDLFEKVNVGTIDSPVYAIKAKYHLYSVGEVSAYEFGEAGGTGVSSLEELIDVQLTNLVADSILKYNGSKWVNIPITEVKGATSWNEIEDKPSTFTPSAHTHTVADITDISPLVLNVNGSGLFTYNGKSSVTANLTVPTKVSQLTNDTGFITGISSSMVTNALGYTPYNSTNPNGYISSITKDMVEGVLTGNITSHTHDYLPLSGGTLTSSIEIYSTGSNWNEGIRIHATSNGFCGVILCGTDNTGSSGTSATTWSAYNKDGNFYINRNASTAYSDYILCNVNGNWGMGTNSPSYKLHVVGDIYTTAGFKKSGSSDSYVLLGGGGHKLISDFATAGHTHSYLPLSGGTMTGPIEIKSSVNNNYNEGLRITRAGNSWAGITFGSTGISGAPSNGWFAATNPNNQFIITPDDSSSTTGLTLNKSGDALWRNNTILHSSNYNSYAPTLTGSGASGTWRISISGKATYLSNAHNGIPATSRGDADYTCALYNGGWASDSLGYATAFGTYIDLSGYSSWYHRLAFNTSGLIEHFMGINTTTLSKVGDIAYTWSNVASATNADMLDGYHHDAFCKQVDLGYYSDYTYYVIGLCQITDYGSIGNSASGMISVGRDNGIYNRSLIHYSIQTIYNTASVFFSYSYLGNGILKPCTFTYNSKKWAGFVFEGNPASTDNVFVQNHYSKYSNAFYIQYYNTHNGVLNAEINNSLSINGSDITAEGGMFSGTLSINGTGNNFTEGIRIHSTSTGWTTFILCGTDNTGNIGSSANSWSMHNYRGNFYINRNSSTETTPYILCNVNGNWGIGTNSPSVKLHVVGDIAATGAVTAKASSSDIRLKTDITDYKALSIIRSHKSIKYHWNAVAKANADIFNDDYWHYGLIAQDVQRDMPQMVSDVFKDYLVINYERLIPICWKGLQEVDDEVTKLKKRVKQLEKRLLKYESTEVFYTKGND